MRGGEFAHLGEQFFFQREDLVFGVEDLALVVLQLGRGEALGVDQSLLALVVGGGQVLVGLGDFDVVAEDVVEADLQRLDAGAGALAGLDLGDDLAAIAAKVAQFVEIGVAAGADGAAIGQVDGRLVGDGLQDAVAGFGDFVQTFVQIAQAGGSLGFESGFQRGDLFERAAQRQHVARVGGPHGDFGQQPLDIQDAAQLFAQFGAQYGLLEQLADRIQPAVDFGAVERWAEQTLAQQAAAHAGPGLIQDVQQSGVVALAGEQRLDQFEVAHGDGVEQHACGAVVIGGTVEVFEGGALRLAQVMQDGARRAHGRRPVGQAASIERQQAEVIAQGAVGVIEAEDPVFEVGAEIARALIFGGEQRQIGGVEDLARAKLFDGGVDFGGVHFGDAELAGGDIHVGHAGAMPDARDGREVVVLVRAEGERIGGGAGRDHARDFALDQFLGERGIFHLVADGYAVALLNEARDVAFSGVIGDATHGDGCALFLVAGGEGDLQLARGEDGVFEEELVEIAEAEEEKGVGHLLFDGVVLPHQRGGWVGGHL